MNILTSHQRLRMWFSKCWMAVFGVVIIFLFRFISETLDSVVLDLGSVMLCLCFNPLMCFLSGEIEEQTTSTASCYHLLLFFPLLFSLGGWLCNVNNRGMKCYTSVKRRTQTSVNSLNIIVTIMKAFNCAICHVQLL